MPIQAGNFGRWRLKAAILYRKMLKAMMQNTREALAGITVVKIKQSQSV